MEERRGKKFKSRGYPFESINDSKRRGGGAIDGERRSGILKVNADRLRNKPSSSSLLKHAPHTDIISRRNISKE